jgi:hypothetical protein
MNKKPFIIFILTCLCGYQVLAAQGIPTPDNVPLPAYSQPAINTQPDADEESVARRVEIVFLLSLPFTTLMSFLLLNAAYYLSDTTYNFSMINLPHEIIPFTVFSALFTGGIITYADYRTVQGKKNNPVDSANSGETRELQLGVGLQKKF